MPLAKIAEITDPIIPTRASKSFSTKSMIDQIKPATSRHKSNTPTIRAPKNENLKHKKLSTFLKRTDSKFFIFAHFSSDLANALEAKNFAEKPNSQWP